SYIATELCVNKDNPITMCYGKCFLDRNMKLVTETEKQEVPTGKHKLEIPVFMLSQISYTLTPAGAHLSESYTEYCDTIPTDFTAAIFHPPALS
ncbi:MAG TPA: hypothetical protein VIM75_15425, partial [Ohtaekwangia sp.]|uniref:hypothetical protein n=1 Tax=Ohtaekwangia sp. TaxID=2066019 RepID=UPI002F94FD63